MSPYVSKAQERYFNANKAKLERQGVNVNEWNAASKGKSLPAHKGTGYKINPSRPGSYAPRQAQ